MAHPGSRSTNRSRTSTVRSSPTRLTASRKPKVTSKSTLDVLALRKHFGLSQRDFWGALGVTQSGGSRYEKGRPLPAPVRKLCRMFYVDGSTPSDAAHSTDDEVILAYLARNPDLRKWLLRNAR